MTGTDPERTETMSKSREVKLLATYYILVNAGMKISDSMKAAVERIQNKQAAAYVAGVKS